MSVYWLGWSIGVLNGVTLSATVVAVRAGIRQWRQERSLTK